MHSMLRAGWLRKAVALAMLASTGACGGLGPSICARPATEEPLEYREGEQRSGTYMTSDWYGDLLFWPGGAHFEFFHNLGALPRIVQPYLSFERDGLTSASLAPAAGNQFEIKDMDEISLRAINGSCVDYWILLVIGSGE